jgi:hypothetical protein
MSVRGNYLMIDTIAFGSIAIHGKQITTDLILYPDGRIEDHWWRNKGHQLTVDDIRALVAAKPDIIIAGTGIYGRMKPDSSLAGWLKQMGIQFIGKPNQKAAEAYNRLSPKYRVGACFHLTC